MKILLIGFIVLAAVVALSLSLARHLNASKAPPKIGPEWSAWQAGDILETERLSVDALSQNETDDHARHAYILACSGLGRFEEAISEYNALSSDYPHLPELDETALWSYVWIGDIDSAIAFAEKRGLLSSPSTREQLRLAADHPFLLEADGVTELPFTEDGFSQYMPGVDAQLNGHAVIARIDTGGSFIHMTRSQAKDFGVSFSGCERNFAALTFSSICYGQANLRLGEAHLINVPVAVHKDSTLPTSAIAEAFDAPLGVIIGTNVFRQFMTTVDAPRKRLLLSPRGDMAAKTEHMARLPDTIGKADFFVVGDHFIIARGRIGNGPLVPLFVDSGLAAFNPTQGQASLLAPESALGGWGAEKPAPGSFAPLPAEVMLGSMAAAQMTVLPVTDKTWRNGFGDWQGVEVEALISYGFLKNWAWTLDFDQNAIVFHSAD